MRRHTLNTCIGATLIFLLLLFPIGTSTGLTQTPEHEEVETLDIIEVPGTAVTQEPRDLIFPEPDAASLQPLLNASLLQIPVSLRINRPISQPPPTLDPVGQTKEIRSPVKPLKAERPVYPRFAREQGWEGTTVVRITVGTDGGVVSATTQKSSGFPILDESAVQTVTQWVFTPAKNGEFHVASTVDLPILFDLDQTHEHDAAASRPDP